MGNQKKWVLNRAPKVVFFSNQANKNSPTGFKFILNRAPKVVFFSNQANIPGLNLGVTEQATYLTDIPVPGDKLQFQDLKSKILS